MSIRTTLFSLVALALGVAVAHSSEESDRAERELATKSFTVAGLDSGWSFAKSTVGKTDDDKTKNAYFYMSGTKKQILAISVIEQGYMPTNEAEAVAFVKRFEDLGYTIKGYRFIQAKRKTFVIEEQTKEIKGLFGASTLIYIQGEGEIYNVTGTIVSDKSDLDERLKIISQVSFDGVVLSADVLGKRKE